MVPPKTPIEVRPVGSYSTIAVERDTEKRATMSTERKPIIPEILWLFVMIIAIAAGGWALVGSCGCTAMERLNLVGYAADVAAQKAIDRGREALVGAADEVVDNTLNKWISYGVAGAGGLGILGGGGLAVRRKNGKG